MLYIRTNGKKEHFNKLYSLEGSHWKYIRCCHKSRRGNAQNILLTFILLDFASFLSRLSERMCCCWCWGWQLFHLCVQSTQLKFCWRRRRKDQIVFFAFKAIYFGYICCYGLPIGHFTMSTKIAVVVMNIMLMVKAKCAFYCLVIFLEINWSQTNAEKFGTLKLTTTLYH